MNNNETDKTPPDPLDAVAASPEHHRVLFENERVRVLDTSIGPGERTEVHMHPWPGVAYYLAGGDVIRYNAEGVVELDSRALGIEIQPGTAMWLPRSMPHSIENVGDREIRAITVELKKL